MKCSNRYRSRTVLLSALLGLCFSCAAETRVDELGRMRRLSVGRGWLDVQADVRIPLKQWKDWLSLSSSNPKSAAVGDRRTWSGTLSKKADPNETNGCAISVDQTVIKVGERLLYEIKATADETSEVEGVVFQFTLPPDQFIGGLFGAGLEIGEFPATTPEPNHLFNTITNSFVFTDATRKAKIRIEFEKPAQVLLQDERKWGGAFAALVFVHSGTLLRGQTAVLRAAISTAGSVEATPANLVMNTKTKLNRIQGIGGSYCFNLNTPMTQFTLDNLKPAYSRTQMSLKEWEPANDDENPLTTDWAKLEARDKHGSALRHEFEMMRELGRRKIPYISSIWYCPEWMYAKPETENGNQVPRDKWPELLESIGTYLQYAKRQYGAEPDLFSFNEPDAGIHVLFSADEHRDFIKAAGAHFKKLKLKTKLLLGDIANPRDTLSYVNATIADKDAMKFVRALSFHSWGGASAQQYKDWRALADKLKLPLIVAEAGPDPDWLKKPWLQPDAVVTEMTHYQNIFLHARPQAIMYWEFTDNFPLLNYDKDKRLQLTERYCLQKHWREFIPPGSEAVLTANDNGTILFTAFRHKPKSGGEVYSLQLANPKWPRTVTINGIPKEVKSLNVVRTSPGELFKKHAAIPVENGSVKLELAAESLTTLTTMEIPDLEKP